VGEKDEVSIKQVADAIVKAVGFTGEYSVRNSLLFSPCHIHTDEGYSSTRARQMDNTRRQHRMRSCSNTSLISSLHLSKRVSPLSPFSLHAD
jgi:hypothetical protein